MARCDHCLEWYHKTCETTPASACVHENEKMVLSFLLDPLL